MHKIILKMLLLVLIVNWGCREVSHQKEESPDKGAKDKTDSENQDATTIETEENASPGTEEQSEPIDTAIKYDISLVIEENCKDGWCFIPAATYQMLVPYEEDCRSKNIEAELTITLTNSFVMGSTAVTQKQWEALGFENSSSVKCQDCPVDNINWFEALAWLNALSEKEGLDTCYDLSCCENTVGVNCPESGSGIDKRENRFKCDCEVYKYNNVYECPGYRLPTYGEKHYTTRAGTTTNTYNGQMTNGESSLRRGEGCVESKILDEIAWYCGNTDRLMPVGLKKPNGFGLYDTIGNPGEWLSDPYQNTEYGGGQEAVTDPHGFLFADAETFPDRAIAAANYMIMTACMTSFAMLGGDPMICMPGFGFRAVRTIFDTSEYVKK